MLIACVILTFTLVGRQTLRTPAGAANVPIKGSQVSQSQTINFPSYEKSSPASGYLACCERQESPCRFLTGRRVIRRYDANPSVGSNLAGMFTPRYNKPRPQHSGIYPNLSFTVQEPGTPLVLAGISHCTLRRAPTKTLELSPLM